MTRRSGPLFLLIAVFVVLGVFLTGCRNTVNLTAPRCVPVFQYTDTAWNAAHTQFVTADIYACPGVEVKHGH